MRTWTQLLAQRRHIVLYDASCSVCQNQKYIWVRLDWFRRLKWLPLTHPDALSLAPGLSREGLEAAIHCITRNGKVYGGARAFRFMAMRVPVLVPSALLLWIPGALWIAERLYAKISRNRHRIGQWITGEKHAL